MRPRSLYPIFCPLPTQNEQPLRRGRRGPPGPPEPRSPPPPPPPYDGRPPPYDGRGPRGAIGAGGRGAPPPAGASGRDCRVQVASGLIFLPSQNGISSGSEPGGAPPRGSPHS